jgi:membrane protease YdiL (CAAX protease family)
MDAHEIPPVIGEVVAEDSPPIRKVSRWRWWTHLVVMAALPLVAGVAGILTRGHIGPLIPTAVPGLLTVSVREMGLLAVLFGIAWLFSKVNGRQLLLRWRGGGWPLLWGLIYSIALRAMSMIVALAAVIIWAAIHRGDRSGFDKMKPQMDHLVGSAALLDNPVYFVLVLTLISFVVAGLREELWRAAMFAGIEALFPRGFAGLKGKITAVSVVAVIFGLGHTAQGALAILVTTLIGGGLGAIMLWHRSIWEAVIAHGFFDATSFALLYLVAKYLPQLLHNN